MTERHDTELDRIARLLALLPPTPQGWGDAARELPLARATLDALVARATADAEERARIVAALEDALAAEGVEPRARVVEELRRRLDA
jgi:hypothetical protein